MYERPHQPIVSPRRFIRRVAHHGLIAAVITAVALAIGVLGYHYVAGKTWVDAFLNASMILGGMGPIGDIDTDAGKIFASFYALFAGLVFIGIAGIMTAPFAHRLLHHFHAEGSTRR